MSSTLKRRIIWFADMSGLHLFLYHASFVPQTLGRIVLFLSWLPWLPLARAHIAVASHLLPTPTAAGLVWCAVVWLAIHWLLASKLAQRSSISLSATAPGID